MTAPRSAPPGAARPPAESGAAGDDGFSLLEALVALAIIGSGLGAVYVLQAQLATNLQRAEAAVERADALTTAVEFARTIDPVSAPSGKAAIGEWRIAWTSEPDGPAQPTVRSYRTAEERTAQMFRVSVTVTDPDGEAIAGPTDIQVLSYRSAVRESGGMRGALPRLPAN